MADNAVQEISWLGARLREPSTYAGLGILLGLVFHLNNSQALAANLQTVGVGAGMLIAGLIAIFVPEASSKTIIKAAPLALFFGAMWFLFGLAPAQAQTAPPVVKAPIFNSVIPPASPCTPASCSGFYVGAFMAGNGTNADIVGSGINGSVFAGGGIPGLAMGFQLANGTYFAAAEVDAGYQVTVPTSVNSVGGNEQGIFAQEIAKVGMNLGGLLGSQAPINVPSQLTAQFISPYVLVGAVERSFANGWATGAGATFDITPHLFLDIRYEYINYGAGAGIGAISFTSENLVSAGLNYKF